MSSKKKISLSLIVLLFFSFCLYQPLGNRREDWPFSFFGMYMGRLHYNDTSRFDIDVVFPDGEKKSIFGYGVNFYYLTDVVVHFFATHEDVHKQSAREDLVKFLNLDVLPVIRKHPLLRDVQSLQVRYRFWNVFSPELRDKADSDLVVLDIPVSAFSVTKGSE